MLLHTVSLMPLGADTNLMMRGAVKRLTVTVPTSRQVWPTESPPRVTTPLYLRPGSVHMDEVYESAVGDSGVTRTCAGPAVGGVLALNVGEREVRTLSNEEPPLCRTD